MLFKFLKFIFYLAIVLGIVGFVFYKWPAPEKEVNWGVTFSRKQAQDLGLDWRQTYLAILDDLGAKRLRLVAYWPEVEPKQDEFNFENLDWQIEQATQRDAEIILAVGQKVPRWPECFIPEWVEEEGRGEELLSYLEKIVKRYKDNPNIIYWQVENEPFFKYFGECPKLDKDLLDREINLVRGLDSRPILMTDSGEFGLWWSAIRRGDVFGTTMYRTVYNKYVGRFDYPLPPNFFRAKVGLFRLLSGGKKIINIELQAEPWENKPLSEVSLEDQYETMNLGKFREHIEFARKTGLSPVYLWGAEWWYYLKKQGDESIWGEAKKLF